MMIDAEKNTLGVTAFDADASSSLTRSGVTTARRRRKISV